ncbi:nucleotidyl transferase AbiEii/AbiGii toxin family protein [Sediminibacterium roseum]|uniref:Nucleotidyl transferase AbiEii/AbiGii toxin family protein n=1 Tax=Sediminibacterium roseum TaxID=1978412 RepID=A0ABW9ZVY1_9BACT|nr:nucleotidyl transferase AbiEii/AbiGii toxin family protein [Sediminibacterium roseum]NCI51318.1 nucleotidyl transferase AbiEii/AbiGii toxin family protein [Sediminibacterium roseum]
MAVHNPVLIETIKELILVALATEEDLMELLVLKGGNAIDLHNDAHLGHLSRASFDLDFSIEGGDFDDWPTVERRMKTALENTFSGKDLVLLDFVFEPQPKTASRNAEMQEFWGGYKATFKVIERKLFELHQGNLETIRRNAVVLRKNHSTVFELEFSKFEYVGGKQAITIDGFPMYIYTPVMIVLEKVRALCQQLPDYASVIPVFHGRQRAKDFYDIWLLMQTHPFDPADPVNKETLIRIFAAKKVPLSYIKQLRENAGFHRDNWNQVENTVEASEKLQGFDFYVNFVTDTFEPLTFP